MSVRWKLLVGACAGALVIILVTSFAIGWISYQRASESIRDLASKQLTSTGSLTAESIERYFDIIEKQVKTFSNDRMIIDAMAQFPSAFTGFRSETNAVSLNTMRGSVESYYLDQFGTKYESENGDSELNISGLYDVLDTTSLALQYYWISNNPNPLGEKDLLAELEIASSYSDLHALYHPHIRAYQQEFDYYDIFLVDIDSGRIVYSVFKELDFSTSLIDGPYSDSGIAQAFNAVKDSELQDATFLTTFASYTPSYEAPAAFIASPIFDGSEKIGVLIFQMPIDVINNIMTHEYQWLDKGLGKTGETYLVSREGLMQSVSRFLIEDKPAYLASLRASGLSDAVVTNIDQKDTSIGFQPVQTEAVNRAFAGESGVVEVVDYRGEPVLSSSHLVSAGDIQFALLSDIDVAEAFSSLPSLQQQIIGSSAVVAVFTLLAAGLAAITFASLIGRQLNKAVNIADRVADGESYDVGVIKGTDEIAKLLRSLDRMQKDLIRKFQHQHIFTNRIKVALDNSSTNVLMLDNNVNIIYMNKAMLAAMTKSSIDRLNSKANVNGQIMKTDVFHFIANHYRQNQVKLTDAYAQLTKTVSEQFLIDDDTYRVTTSPVVEHDGDRLGVVVEWKNITEELLEQRAKENELQQQKEQSQRNARIKQALDNVSTNVIVADADHQVIYVNIALQRLFEKHSQQLKSALDNINLGQIIGSDMRVFQPKDSESKIFAFSEQPQKALVAFNELFIQVTANPVYDGPNRIGSVYEWINRTEELASEKQVQHLVNAAVAGDLSIRINSASETGFYRTLSDGLNQIMDTVSSSIDEVVDVFDGMAQGDLTKTIDGQYQGTFAKLKNDANQVVSELAKVVTEIRQAATRVASGANEIAQGNNDLQRRSEDQAASIEQTSASMESITESIQMQARSASDADRFALSAEKQAVNGGDVVDKAIVAMAEINSASKKIADIISVIDSIAFQTNLLALNASVEAARAGDQGRGFAVVASEVRNLAQRSAAAAKEISELIKDSVNKVANGTQLVNASGVTLKEIVNAVREVSSVISSVSVSATEQSENVSQVNLAVSKIDEGIQQTVTLVQQSSQASSDMANQANDMINRLAFFNTNNSK